MIMSPQTQALLDQVLRLPIAEREFFVNELSISLDDAFEYTPELAAEVRRREADLDSGATQAISHEEALRLMFEKRDG